MPAETHVEKGPLGRHEVFELVRDQLADILEIEPGSISESSSFAEDLDADSLALIELVERTYAADAPFDFVGAFAFVGRGGEDQPIDLGRALRRRLRTRRRPSR